jgi:hypothetical protein
MLKTRWSIGFLLVGLFLSLPLASQAFTARRGDEINFRSGDQLSGTTYAAGRQIVVDTPLPGDFICAGNDIFINQPVSGDVICLAENIKIDAEIGGSLRLLGSSINIDNQIGRNASLFGSKIFLGQQAIIDGETLSASIFLDSRGAYRQDFHGLYNQARLYGHYQGVVNLISASDELPGLEVVAGAKLDNGLIYRSNQLAKIDLAAQITGQVDKRVSPVKQLDKSQQLINWLWSKSLGLFMLLVFGLVIFSLWPKLGDKLLQHSQTHPIKLILQGLAILIILPIIILILAVTIVGLPVALAGLIIWIALLYGARLVVAYWLSSKIMTSQTNRLWPFLIGIIIIIGLSWLPVLGRLIIVLATWWGTGVIWHSIYKVKK